MSDSVVEEYDGETMKCRKANQDRIVMQGLNKENMENIIFTSMIKSVNEDKSSITAINMQMNLHICRLIN
jgi:hypothetical protein